MKRIILFLFLLLIIISSCRKKHFKCDSPVSYKNDIQPFLDSHCNKCHSYDTYAEAKILASNGQLKEVTINTSKMPPDGEKRLSLKERKKIYCWLEGGSLNN